MSIFRDLARFAESRFQAHAERRTHMLLNALPEDIQKDIGWRWAPRGRGQHNRRDMSFFGH